MCDFATIAEPGRLNPRQEVSMLDITTPSDAPAALLRIARQIARAFVPARMISTAETAAVCLLLDAVRERRLDDHGEFLSLLRRVYTTTDPEHEAQLYELMAEDCLRLAANARRDAEGEDTHEADETAMLHTVRAGRAA